MYIQKKCTLWCLGTSSVTDCVLSTYQTLNSILSIAKSRVGVILNNTSHRVYSMVDTNKYVRD